VPSEFDKVRLPVDSFNMSYLAQVELFVVSPNYAPFGRRTICVFVPVNHYT